YFNYNYDLIRKITVTNKSTDLPLADLLKFIAIQTDLQFLVEKDVIYVSRQKGSKDNENKSEKIHLDVPAIELLQKDLSSMNTKVIYQVSLESAKMYEVVKGTITSEDGEPLIGATVMVQESGQGTVTDIDGTFSISVPDEGNATLEVSYIGYQTQIVQVGDQTELNIILTSTLTELNEVIVVGYGTQLNSKVSAAVDQIEVEELEIDKRPVSNLESSLVGSIPGLILNQTSGQLGANVGIQVRAASALEDKNALILVDGFESSIDNINPYDIASVTILKDAASTAIYGARGANGVVLITTKNTSRDQKPSITLNSNVAWQQPVTTADQPNSLEWMSFFNEAELAEASISDPDFDPSTFTPTFTQADLDRAASGFYPETNWIEELYNETAFQSSNNLTLSGGTQKVGYLMGLGYLNQDGTTQGEDNLERLSLRLKLDADVTDWLTVGTNIFNAYQEINNVPLSTGNGLRGQPFFPVQLNSGELAGTYVFKGSTSAAENPIAAANSGSFNNVKLDELNLQLYGQVKPIDNLMIEGRVSYFNLNNDQLVWNNPYEYIILDFEDLEPNGNPVPFASSDRSLANRTSRTNRINTLLTANYDLSLTGGHNLNALVGLQTTEGETTSFSAERFDFILDNLPSLNLGAQIEGFGNDASFANDRSTISYFSRLSYDLNSKYLLEFNFRADASSNFVKNKWGFFPAVSAGWNVHLEDFMKDLDFISGLKLRASWGINGDDGTLNGVETAITDLAGIAFGGNIQPTIQLSNAVNPDLTWETSEKLNFGLFLELLQGKIYFNGDYFIDNRSDIITFQLTSAESGLGGVLDNVYDAKTWGYELGLGYRDNFGKFGVNAGFNLSYYNSEITSGEGDAPLNTDPENYQIEGSPIRGVWYGWETNGYFNSAAEVESYNVDQSGVVTQGDDLGRYVGGFRYVDQNGDGVIDADDRVILRDDAVDNYRIGGNLALSYSGFTLSTRIYGVLSAYEWWNSGSVLNAYTSGGIGPYNYQRDTWRADNTDSEFPLVYLNNRPYEPNVSGLIKDRAFIKIKNVNLSYSFDQKVLNKLGWIKGLDLYVSFENLGVLWSNFPAEEFNFDPEFGATSFNYPLPLKTSVGLNISL
ncbi:MAG: SusC/RagA family TonB-linked outer membrane protein, partial [Bacteroidota bacterium]